MTTTNTPRWVPVGADGLEGWTSCCEASVTYSGSTLCCKACWNDVEMVQLEGKDAETLSRIVTEVIEGTITADQGVARQHDLLNPGPDPQFQIGQRVTALYPNTRWGSGLIIEIRSERGLKPFVVRSDDGMIGHFHNDQIEATR